ncbi:penicillin-binding transpeptidase domain-containing protein [Seohaeicola saemankumensis]|uniref:penicillin-binding transpeptidase domain-containing protein n=1 Tax=Seohaeicola TaxID=481178 RepID=UPI0035D067E7
MKSNKEQHGEVNPLMRHILYAATVAVLLGSGCTPTAPLITDVGVIDRVPRRALANSPVQREAAAVLLDGMREMNAAAGAVVIMDVNTGRVLSLVSVVGEGAADAEEPQFNRAANNVHELGAAMRIFAVAQAIDEGLVTPDTMIETPQSLSIGRFAIRDYRPRDSQMTPADIFLNSSFVGSAQIGQKIGPERQQEFLGSLGLLEGNHIEEQYPTDIAAMRPKLWGSLSAATIAYGFGLTVSPLQLAAGYASLVNGGTRVHPTFGPLPRRGERIVSRETSAYVRELLRESVVTGTARLTDAPAYSPGGATGTSEVRMHHGGNSEEKLVTTFVAVFPIEKPRYVLVTLLEDPVLIASGSHKRTAAWTAAPVSAKIMERVGPLLFKNHF